MLENDRAWIFGITTMSIYVPSAGMDTVNDNLIDIRKLIALAVNDSYLVTRGQNGGKSL